LHPVVDWRLEYCLQPLVSNGIPPGSTTIFPVALAREQAERLKRTPDQKRIFRSVAQLNGLNL
jgi:hypothetical protein